MEEIMEMAEKLKDRPYALFYLYNKYTTHNEFNIPNFIDRVKEVKYLIKLGLIRFSVKPGKHLHKKNTLFTEKGNRVYEFIYKQGLLAAFSDIPLQGSSAFKAHYYSKIDRILEDIKIPESEALQILMSKIPGLNQWFKPSKLKLKINNVILINKTEHLETLKYEIDFKCETCVQDISPVIEIVYNFDDINKNPNLVICPKCGTHYHLCLFFECFYSLSF